MKYLISALFLLMCCPLVWADNINDNREWWADSAVSYIQSGCTPTVPTSSLTITTFACRAYIKQDNKWYGVDQAAITFTIADATPTWLAVHRSSTATVSGWTRPARGHYLYQQSATKPADPDGGVVFAEVTVAGSIITAIDLYGPRIPGGNVSGPGSMIESDTLDTVFDRGKTIDGANSKSNAVRIGNGTIDWCIYTDAGGDYFIEACQTGVDTAVRIKTNQQFVLLDEEDGTNVITADPDANGLGDGTVSFRDPLINTTIAGKIASTTHASDANFITILEHLTDCTSITDGKAGELCWERDDNNLYICEPTSGDCDIVAEWTNASRDSFILNFACSDADTANDDDYANGYGPPSTACEETDTIDAQVSVPYDSIIEKIIASVGTAPGAGENVVFTVRKNSVDTAITCTISDTNQNCTVTGGTVTVTALSEILSVKFDASATAADSGEVRVTIGLIRTE